MDDDALRAFIEANYGRLIGLLRLKGCTEVDAEDVAQETMVRLVKHWANVQKMDNPWGWVTLVAVNISTSRWRRVRTALARRHLVATAGSNVHYDHAAVEAMALLDGLTDRQRVAVVLRHYAGLSVREAAEAMGVAEGTVKSLCSAGLAAAREDRLAYDDIHFSLEVPR